MTTNGVIPAGSSTSSNTSRSEPVVRFVEELNVKGKRVFLRVDFNVPLTEQGEIRDDTRIRASLPTITYLLGHGAKLVIASHLGRPKGKVDPKKSLKPVAVRLASLIPNKVTQAPEVVGTEVTRLSSAFLALWSVWTAVGLAATASN